MEAQTNKKETILIVDDIEINRAVLTEIFKNDYETIEACNGVEALEIINGGRDISAVLLDLLMPELNGLGVLKDMNESGKLNSIPVFLIRLLTVRRCFRRGMIWVQWMLLQSRL